MYILTGINTVICSARSSGGPPSSRLDLYPLSSSLRRPTSFSTSLNGILKKNNNNTTATTTNIIIITTTCYIECI